MRGFVRTPVPEVLVIKGDQWAKRWVALRDLKPNATFTWYQHQNKSAREWLLPLLRKMTDGHCSFCDSFPLEGQSNEPIEHFRPKSTFPNLAYDWGNLYYCCEKCQTTKKEVWSEELLAPDQPGYRWSDWFEFDYTTGHVRPNQFAEANLQTRASITIRIYGLASDERARRRILELKKWRSTNLEQRELNSFAHRDYLENHESAG